MTNVVPASVLESSEQSLRQRLRDFSPRPLNAPDATTVLSIYLFLLLVIPSDAGIGPLGAAGSPAGLFALAMLLWWLWHKVRGLEAGQQKKTQPIRVALYVFSGFVLASYVYSSQHALPFVDSNAATMNVMKIAGFAGVILVANDGLRDRERFMVLLLRLAWFGSLYASLGLIQFFTGENFVDQIQIPGLQSSGSGGVDSRGGFVRPEATARHALEYATVLTVTLPIALTLAMNDHLRRPLSRWLPTVLISLASVLSVTRSALLGLIAVLIILVPTWEPRIRRIAAAVIFAGAAALYVVVPGLGGTIMGMFSGSDPSIDSRTSSYSAVSGYLEVSPWIGRGLGTMTVDYRIFDNQYIGLLIEIGIVGTAAFMALLLIAATCTLLRRRGSDKVLGALGPAFGSAILAGALLSAFFDSFHFPQAVGMLCLMLGLAGAHWNMPQAPGEIRRFRARESKLHAPLRGGGIARVGSTFMRRWYVVVFVLGASVPLALLTNAATGVYYTKFDIIFQAPPGATKDNALRTEASSTVHYAAMIQRLYESTHPAPDIQPVRAPLYGTGLRDVEAVYLPSMGGQWQTNFNKSQISVEIVKNTPEEARLRAEEISKEISELALAPQIESGVWKSSRITTERVALTVPVGYVGVRVKYALVVLALLSLGTAVGSAAVFDQFLCCIRRERRRATRNKH